MQQYFVDATIKTGDVVTLDQDILYHLIKVLRKDSFYTFRLADREGKIFHSHLIDDKHCLVDEYLAENNELATDVTCILALIKSDKFELCLQKLTELGVKRIVPYEARRSVLKINKASKLDRFRKIIREAAEQSHRNFIPELTEVAGLNDLKKYKSELNYICYESERDLSTIQPAGSISYIIGPEGGFEKSEYETICDLGFESLSLGRRILRAETAALYMSSVIISKCQ